MTRPAMVPMLVGVGGEIFVTIVRLQPLLVLLVPYVAEALEEEEAEDVVLVLPGVDPAAEDVGGLP